MAWTVGLFSTFVFHVSFGAPTSQEKVGFLQQHKTDTVLNNFSIPAVISNSIAETRTERNFADDATRPPAPAPPQPGRRRRSTTVTTTKPDEWPDFCIYPSPKKAKDMKEPKKAKATASLQQLYASAAPEPNASSQPLRASTGLWPQPEPNSNATASTLQLHENDMEFCMLPIDPGYGPGPLVRTFVREVQCRCNKEKSAFCKCAAAPLPAFQCDPTDIDGVATRTRPASWRWNGRCQLRCCARAAHRMKKCWLSQCGNPETTR